jgi:2',3'-cyclic-nucleotide 2'-phosphodiesterase/3'-nucleotidase/5'-nucleotidase
VHNNTVEILWSTLSLTFSLITPPVVAVGGNLSMAAQLANAEISAFNPASGYLYTVGGGSGSIVVSDLRNPATPRIVARAVPADSAQTLQSVAVHGNLLAVAVQNAVKTEPGMVQFYQLGDNPAIPTWISTVNVGALPDMVKFSADGNQLLVTNEGEPNAAYSIDPQGSISVINTGVFHLGRMAPGQGDVKTIGFEAWDNRRAELIHRGVRITGKAGVTTSLAQDIEPEAIAISADGKTAYISLQENNAIAVLDISTSTPKISSIFSAGIKDWDRGQARATNYNAILSYAAGNANLPAGAQPGGLSGLWFAGVETVSGKQLDIYYSITDRGPNGTLVAGRRQFLDPDFQPSIYKLGMERATGMVSELGKIGLNRVDGTPLTGLPQLSGKDEIPVDAAGNPLAYDPFGIDSETISVLTVTIAGVSRKVFAVGDEYRSQIALFDFNTGNLIQRYIPAGQKALLEVQHGDLIGAETIDSLPAIYGNRWANRGIEGMAFNSNDGLLYAFLQSPLDVDSNNDGVVAERSLSQLTRILAIQPASGAPVKEHLYLLSGRVGQDKIGDVTFDASRNVFLVMERDSSRALNGFKSVVEVDLRGATNTLPYTQGTTSWADAIGVASPELLDNSLTLVGGVYTPSSADRLAAAGIKLAHKVELFNLPSVGGTISYDKPEGLTLRDDGALVINYDNDFGTEGADGNAFTVVSFSNPALDTEDSGDGGGYKPATNHDVYGLTMPDGLATFRYNGEDFILAAGEGDDRNDFLDPDETARVSALLTAAASATPAQKAGLLAANALRLNILTNTGDLDGDGIVDQAYTLGSRSLRIYDSKGNVVFDSGTALEELAVAKGIYPINSREDDKGVEPEMVEVISVNGRIYAFVALERSTTSMAAVFDVTNPYAPVAVDPVIFSGAQRVEGITFLSSATNAARSVIASSEGNDVVSVVDFPIPYRLQLLHLSDGEAGLLGSQTAPYLAGLVDAFDNAYANTLILAGGDNFIPSPFLNGGTDLSVRDELNATTGSSISLSSSTNHPIAAVDLAIHNLIGVEASTIGNHEFDLGTRVFRDAFTPGSVAGWLGAQFPYLSANLDFSGDSDLNPRFTNTTATAGLEEASSLKGRIVPSAVVSKNGEKIGLVGATTQVLEQISSTGGVEVKGFSGKGNERDDMALLASQLQPVIDDLINQGVNKVILMAHLQQLVNEKTLASLLRGVDIILAGGSNTRLGDSTDQAVDLPGHPASFADTYPLVASGADGGTTLIVNTDNEYTYLGRLVVDFDAQGRIIPISIDPLVSGAYAATAANLAKAWNVSEAQLATTAFAEGSKAENVQDLTDAVQAVISSKDGQVWGYSSVYLEGERALVRGQETNLGNLTADANLAYARSIDPSVVLSLKNGGGIRSQIGAIDVITGAKLPPAANPSAGKLEGGVSTLDIENSLRFNNSLSLITVTASKLRDLLEHGVASYPNQGRFPQVSGVAFSFDPSKPAGNRIVNMAIEDAAGRDLDVIVRDGALTGDPGRPLRLVTLNFLAGGGDGYPFPTGPAANRVDLFDPAVARTGAATFAGNGTEQDVLAEYLASQHGSLAAAYRSADTPATADQRLQNLSQRSDTILDQLIYTPGPTTVNGVNLGTTAQGYAVQTSSGTPIQVSFSGGNASASNPGNGWSAIAAAPTSTGFAFYWRNSASQQVARWNLNPSGIYESGVVLSANLILSEEASLGLDLNSDGYTAGPSTLNGLNLGTTAAGYALRSGNATPIQVTDAGANASASNPGNGWIAVAASPSAGGGASLYWRNSISQQVRLWALDATGVNQSDVSLSPSQLASAEANLNMDLNGDGSIAVSLGSTPQGYALLSAGQPAIQVVYAAGNASASNPGNGWSATAVAVTGSGYSLYWANSVSQQSARWSLDASGVYQSGDYLTTNQLFGEEAKLKRDLNGDGFIAGPSTIQGLNLGSTSQGYALQTGSGAPVQVSWSGGQASADNPGNGWSATAALSTASGSTLYWKNEASGQLARWNLSASGTYQSGAFLSNDELYSEEASLNADLNGDAIIGAAYTAIESQGNATLLRRNDGQAFVEAGGSRYRVSSPFNLGVGDSSSTWQMQAAEQVDGQNQILWRNNAEKVLHLWNLDAGWNWQSSNGAINPLSPAALGLEASFQVDLNGNGVIG